MRTGLSEAGFFADSSLGSVSIVSFFGPKSSWDVVGVVRFK